jgi:hypothetical protein
LDVFANATDDKGKILWNDVSRMLLSVMINETFAQYPGTDGFIVRTGETWVWKHACISGFVDVLACRYVFDTPYHVGNSPSNGTNARWTEFITFLRQQSRLPVVSSCWTLRN